ncbi:MAG: cell division protein FtsA [Alphaproteobacteria bacterium]|nr:cell division protein FtsA [Alphaproteobacteria bacterium]
MQTSPADHAKEVVPVTRSSFDRPEIVGLLDIGSAKVCCAIVERSWPAGLNALPAMRILGVGHQRSHGVKAGMVIDLDRAEAAVRAAVGQAERMADLTLEDVIATVSCGRLKSAHLTTHADLAAGHVRPEDLDRLSRAAREYAARDDRTLVHMNLVSYLLDGETGIRDPLRLAGRRLSANWHVVTADIQPLHNLSLLIDRTYLGVRQFVPASLAAALAATTMEERRLGVTCVNIGAGVMDIAAFSGGQYLYTDTIPIGGGHLTYDIARFLSTPLAEAERIKTLYGTLVGARSHEHEPIQYMLAGEMEGEAYQTSRAEVYRILYPRVESQIKTLRDRLVNCDAAAKPGPNIVITGGASQMVGFVDMAVRQLDRPVRIGNPAGVAGVPASMNSPAFSAVIGMAGAAPVAATRSLMTSPARSLGGGYLDRMEQWLRESF